MRPIILVCLLLAACAARPLTDTEQAFVASVMGDAIATSDVRVVNGAVVGLFSATYDPRPRVTCRERLSPPRTEPVTGNFAAFVLGNTMYYSRPAYLSDFLSDYPEGMELRQAMRLAHELTHVWQWQTRSGTGYHPVKAAREHQQLDDPYLTEIDPEKPFLEYGWEQQGILVEEFVCCRALDPAGARTADITKIVAQVFPEAARAEAVPADRIRLPWTGADTEGICS